MFHRSDARSGLPAAMNAGSDARTMTWVGERQPYLQVLPALDKKKVAADSVSLVEVGPRCCLNPIRVFAGSFGGPVIYENTSYVRLSPFPPPSNSSPFCARDTTELCQCIPESPWGKRLGWMAGGIFYTNF